MKHNLDVSLLAILSVAIGFSIVCFGCEEKKEIPKTSIILKGAELLKEPLTKIGQEFEKVYAEYEVIVAGGSSDRGIGAIIDNTDTNIGMVLYPLGNDDKNKLQTKKLQYATYPIIKTRTIFIVNKKNPVSLLDLETLKAVLTGEKRRWTDIKAGLTFPGETMRKEIDFIQLCGREPNTAEYHLVQKEIIQLRNFFEEFVTLGSDEEVMDYVEKHVNAIGFISIYHFQPDLVTWLKIQEYQKDEKKPNQSTDNPLIQKGYLLAIIDPPDKEAKLFIDFVYQPESLNILQSFGLVPLNKEEQVQGEDFIDDPEIRFSKIQY